MAIVQHTESFLGKLGTFGVKGTEILSLLWRVFVILLSPLLGAIRKFGTARVLVNDFSLHIQKVR